MSDIVRYELDEDVAVVTFDDGKANVLAPDSIAALDEALDRAESEAKTLMIAGRPGRFSAGFDLSIMQGGTEAVRDLLGAGGALALRLFEFPTPVVLAVTGHALAMGAILLFGADLRIGTEGEFKVGLNEVAIGMPVPTFGVELARARLSKRHFTKAVSLAHIYDPDSAVDAGYLDEVARADDVVSVAVGHAHRLADSLNAAAFARTRINDRAAATAAIRAGLDDDLAAFTVER
jgi:enoyl-CoA hydratase/carnithine racemase